MGIAAVVNDVVLSAGTPGSVKVTLEVGALEETITVTESTPLVQTTSTAQMQVVGKRHYGRKAVPTGGGGGRAGARELFDTLLLWRGRVKVDSAGRARIEVPLNDSLTSFRLVAVASAGDEYFGTGHATIRTTQELILHSGLTPLVREGDRYTAAFTVRNASKRRMTVRATAMLASKPAWEPTSTTTAAKSQKKNSSVPIFKALTVEIPAGGARDVAWPVTAPAGVDSLAWTVEAVEIDITNVERHIHAGAE